MPPFAAMKYLLVCGVGVVSRHQIRFRGPPALDSLSGPQSIPAVNLKGRNMKRAQVLERIDGLVSSRSILEHPFYVAWLGVN